MILGTCSLSSLEAEEVSSAPASFHLSALVAFAFPFSSFRSFKPPSR